MKLNSPSRFTSFYESFSDLIFATMAIFVLLMIIFLSLIKPSENTDELKEKLKQAQEILAETQQALEQSEFEKEKSRDQLEEVTEQMVSLEESVRSRGLELIIAVDVSGSMGNALGHLVETIRTISAVLPKVAPEFRIGIVAYAEIAGVSGGLQVFETRQIFTEQKDSGRSLTKIYSFMDTLAATPGLAPVGRAIDKAIALTSDASQFDGYQTIMLLGDVGPYETPDGDWDKVEPVEREVERKTWAKIRKWALKTESRNFISLFSGKPLSSNSTEKERASMNFFREAANSAGQPENFTQNPGKMLAYLLTAIVKDN